MEIPNSCSVRTVPDCFTRKFGYAGDLFHNVRYVMYVYDLISKEGPCTDFGMWETTLVGDPASERPCYWEARLVGNHVSGNHVSGNHIGFFFKC